MSHRWNGGQRFQRQVSAVDNDLGAGPMSALGNKLVTGPRVGLYQPQISLQVSGRGGMSLRSTLGEGRAGDAGVLLRAARWHCDRRGRRYC